MNSLQNKILEISWLALAILALVAGIHKTIDFGFKVSIIFYIISLISFIVFYFRRKKRLKSESNK